MLAENYDRAADIDDCLQRWGHYRLAVNMHERLSGRLIDPQWQMATANALGTSYATLGRTGRAIRHIKDALAIARETGDRRNEGSWLGALGGCYADLGQTGRAVEHYQQAAEIGDDAGNAQV